MCGTNRHRNTAGNKRTSKNHFVYKKSDSFIAGFNRENLFLQIVPKTQPTEQTLEFIKKFPNQSGIIYCLARRQVDELTEILANEGFSVNRIMRDYRIWNARKIKNVLSGMMFRSW